MAHLQALFVARGADVEAARRAVASLVAVFLQKQAYMLAMRDTFYVGIGLVALALVATLFVRGQPRRVQAPEQEAEAGDEPERAQAALIG
jgi:hypothetical protein